MDSSVDSRISSSVQIIKSNNRSSFCTHVGFSLRFAFFDQALILKSFSGNYLLLNFLLVYNTPLSFLLWRLTDFLSFFLSFFFLFSCLFLNFCCDLESFVPDFLLISNLKILIDQKFLIIISGTCLAVLCTLWILSKNEFLILK